MTNPAGKRVMISHDTRVHGTPVRWTVDSVPCTDSILIHGKPVQKQA